VESHILASAVCSIFSKLVRNLVKLPVTDTESDPNHNVGRTDLSGELGSVPAPRETDPTPVVTRPGAGPSSAMVTRSRAREGRGMNVEPEMEFRPEVEFRQEMGIPAETCEGGLGTARPTTIDTAHRYTTADKPEVTATFTSQEVTTSFPTENAQTATPHNRIASYRTYVQGFTHSLHLSFSSLLMWSRVCSCICNRFAESVHGQFSFASYAIPILAE